VRVGLFITCLADTLVADAGRAVVAVIERLGHEVVFPIEQTCCGQMHVNSGYAEEAVPLARRMVGVLSHPSFDAVVSPSASCVGTVIEQYPRLAGLAGDERLAEEVGGLAPRVYEFSQFLVERLGVEDVGASFPHRVAYHPTCHSLRGIEVGEAPLRLLRNVAGLDLEPLSEAESCCGFGGTFAVKNADTSVAMLTDKVRSLLDARVEYCTAVDSSCLLQIGGALSRQRAGIDTIHLAEILAARE
jgi:L-lactate dehydrogenase complex protein LldE